MKEKNKYGIPEVQPNGINIEYNFTTEEIMVEKLKENKFENILYIGSDSKEYENYGRSTLSQRFNLKETIIIRDFLNYFIEKVQDIILFDKEIYNGENDEVCQVPFSCVSIESNYDTEQKLIKGLKEDKSKEVIYIGCGEEQTNMLYDYAQGYTLKETIILRDFLNGLIEKVQNIILFE